LIAALVLDADAVAKDLEVYATAQPPTDYSLDLEVDGVLREADARGWERFHLVGYSGGGAAALAFTARHPDRLLSLALLEPAWAGTWDRSPAEQAVWDEYDRLEGLPPGQFMPAFMRLNLKPGVSPPPPPAGEAPPWMAKRPAGISAFVQTFKTYDLDHESLRHFCRPVYYALGGLSNPDQFGEISTRLGRVFPDFTIEVFDERHHFDPATPSRARKALKLAKSALAASRMPGTS
jgi:pimeloyl-ACP methyl ester carboxylesterase